MNKDLNKIEQWIGSIWRANGERPSRFHTLKGELAPASALANIPLAAFSYAKRRVTGLNPAMPWIPRSAIASLENLSRRDWRVVEFGSGMSTAWWAARVNEVVTAETDAGWHQNVCAELQAAGHSNVRSVFAAAGFAGIDLGVEPGSVDLVVVDGPERDLCVQRALFLVKPGGYIYLDNSDVQSTERRIAAGRLADAATAAGGTCQTFIDFPPGLFQVAEGTLAYFPRRPVPASENRA